MTWTPGLLSEGVDEVEMSLLSVCLSEGLEVLLLLLLLVLPLKVDVRERERERTNGGLCVFCPHTDPHTLLSASFVCLCVWVAIALSLACTLQPSRLPLTP